MNALNWRTGIPGASKRNLRWFSVHNLRYHKESELPLAVSISSTSMAEDHVVYNCTVSSVTSKKTWTVSYRYSTFVDFKAKLESQWTCHDLNCPGSCQAVRDIVSAYFPKKRLPFLSSNQGVITSRKRRFELILVHLLRSVLLPGSAMKCLHARQNLPSRLFEFLGVKNESDRRSLMHIFVDNYQAVVKKNQTTPQNYHRSKAKSAGCMMCLCDVDLQHDHKQCDSSLIVLPCKHKFHRWCIFQRLLIEIHCPVCRMRVCSSATSSHCCPKRHTDQQWWLSSFEEDLLN